VSEKICLHEERKIIHATHKEAIRKERAIKENQHRLCENVLEHASYWTRKDPGKGSFKRITYLCRFILGGFACSTYIAAHTLQYEQA